MTPFFFRDAARFLFISRLLLRSNLPPFVSYIPVIFPLCLLLFHSGRNFTLIQYFFMTRLSMLCETGLVCILLARPKVHSDLFPRVLFFHSDSCAGIARIPQEYEEKTTDLHPVGNIELR